MINAVTYQTVSYTHLDVYKRQVLGDTFDAYEVCLVKPGEGPFFEYAKTNFPVHAGCPILAGITKCIEAEQQLALKKDASIEFIEE